ncbi:hypothetical protein OS188_14495 [Xanthomarina sp. F1114]|uniref:hypothetical protein n=1 Tax=Xanthomarina sp. F1114 TaxID=2996019 RepID=UPI00225E541E|nr:hypothetical protein [Xanthomarina sp. F1114]MCX7549163.1 hypothetical protein [Xanthomarina sp. F1114]
MKIIGIIILTILIVGFIFFRSWDYLIKYKNKQAGKKYCEENGLTFLSAKSYELHTRLYFEKDGTKSWANYETDRKYNITWKKETPEEKVENKRTNK